MIKRFLFFLFIITTSLLGNGLNAQIIKGEAIIGQNFSKVEGDRVNNGIIRFNKPGLAIGAGALVPLWGNLDANIQVLYTQKGAYHRNGHPDSLKPNYRTALNYAEVPFLIQYTDKERVSIGTGVSYSRLVDAKWIVNGHTITDNVNDKYFSQDNFDWLLDFKIRIWKQLKFNLRYSYSLTSIWSGPEEALLETQAGEKQSMDQRNSMVSFRLVWVFNEQQSNINRRSNE
jgi:hypothetical protein